MQFSPSLSLFTHLVAPSLSVLFLSFRYHLPAQTHTHTRVFQQCGGLLLLYAPSRAVVGVVSGARADFGRAEQSFGVCSQLWQSVESSYLGPSAFSFLIANDSTCSLMPLLIGRMKPPMALPDCDLTGKNAIVPGGQSLSFFSSITYL